MQHHKLLSYIFLICTLAISLAGCSENDNEEATQNPTFKTSMPDTAPAGAIPPPGFEEKSWRAILQMAENQQVNWYMWGGNPAINKWVTNFVAPHVLAQYGITLKMIPLKDISVAVELIHSESREGIWEKGKVDLIWINGENYRNLRKNNLLFGPWSMYLPNSIYVDWEDPTISNDFGYPVEGYESPYGTAQMVFIYDKNRLPSPPGTLDSLIEWIKKNPGKFTYPAPPDFVGSAFIRHICYWAAGGHEQLSRKIDSSVIGERLETCYQILNNISPYLWDKGQKYPVSEAELNNLFMQGEVEIIMNYEIHIASTRIRQGKYPDTVRTFVLQSGTTANTNYVAIPFNSTSKAAAMVVANFLLSPEAQLDKWVNWGSGLAIDPLLLPPVWRAKMFNIPLGPATLPSAVLSEYRLPEISSEWIDVIEQGWLENVYDPRVE